LGRCKKRRIRPSLMTYLLLEHRLAKLVNAVDLEELFSQINPNGGGLHSESSCLSLK
jgi:hypothetical protein